MLDRIPLTYRFPLFVLIVSFVLFVLFTPGVVFRVKQKNRNTTAAIHAAIFAVVETVILFLAPKFLPLK